MTDDHSSGHSTAMLICCAMKILLVGIIILGWSTSGFALITENWHLLGGGLGVIVVGGVLYMQHRRDRNCDSPGEPAD